MNIRKLASLVLAVALALSGSMLMSAQAEAQGSGPQCLLCHQSMHYEDFDRDGKKEWKWIHYFDLESGDDCAESQGEMCRACGFGSECHGPNESGPVVLGQCHEACLPVVALRELDRTVTTVLAAQLDSQTGPALAERVAAEQGLVYDLAENTLALIGCEGVVKRWTLDESARTYFTPRSRSYPVA